MISDDIILIILEVVFMVMWYIPWMFLAHYSTSPREYGTYTIKVGKKHAYIRYFNYYLGKYLLFSTILT